MNNEIVILRNELHNVIEEENSTQSEYVIKLSEELDILILEYYKTNFLSLQGVRKQSAY